MQPARLQGHTAQCGSGIVARPQRQQHKDMPQVAIQPDETLASSSFGLFVFPKKNRSNGSSSQSATIAGPDRVKDGLEGALGRGGGGVEGGAKIGGQHDLVPAL